MTTELEFRDKLNLLVQNAPDKVREKFKEDVEIILGKNVVSIDSLLAVINDSSQSADVREIACWLAPKIGGQDSILPLQMAANDKNANVRRQAIQGLGELDTTSPQVLGILKQAVFNDTSDEVRKIAAYSLGLLATRDGMEALIDVLCNKSELSDIRGMAAESLVNFQDPLASSALIASLSDSSPEVRYWSAFTLGSVGDEDALAPLTQLATSDDVVLPKWGSLRDVAKRAIKAINARLT